MPRSRLGPLAIESKLGDHPSQSCVWRAVHVQLHRAVAVKVFSVPFGATPVARASLAREWETLKKLSHPAIAKCFGGGFEESDAYLAHEFVEGETLSTQLERRTRLAWESVLDLAEPIIEALEYLHGRDVIHGQMQPDKIVISGLSPVLIDVRSDRAGSPFRSGHPLTVAELALRPPELFDAAEHVSAGSDLYSFGAILYLAITGRPPIDGETIEEIAANVASQTPEPVASIVMDCPVWLDNLIMQLLSKNPSERPFSASAVRLALAEVRRRAMSRTGVAEHTSAGFSPLNVTDQKDRDEARSLLGQAALDDDSAVPDGTPWHDKPWILIAALFVLTAGFAYILWPLNEDQMRSRAEALLVEQSRTSRNQAKTSYLEPMLTRFPEGKHNQWAREQIDHVEMLQAEHALSVKLKRNLALTNEGERLYAEASEFDRFGDVTTALDRYRSMETLLGDDPKYRPFVNLARRQIAEIERDDRGPDEAAAIIEQKLAEADQLWQDGKVVSARQIWYSVIELYGNNDNVAPWVAQTQDRLAESKLSRTASGE
jgi:serine/threonine protein kinase